MLYNPFMFEENSAGVVYGLVDVRLPEAIRYIGGSEQHPAVRVNQHVNGVRNTAKTAWVEATGADLRYIILEVVPIGESLPLAEYTWFHRLRPQHDLLNGIAPPQFPPGTHGTVAHYSNGGCRCSECRAANAAAQTSKSLSRSTRLEDAPHGTVGGYSNWGCRCDACRAAWKPFVRNQRAERLARAAADPSIIPHGRSGYLNWGCKCEVCSSAARAYYSKRSGRCRS